MQENIAAENYQTPMLESETFSNSSNESSKRKRRKLKDSPRFSDQPGLEKYYHNETKDRNPLTLKLKQSTKRGFHFNISINPESFELSPREEVSQE